MVMRYSHSLIFPFPFPWHSQSYYHSYRQSRSLFGLLAGYWEFESVAMTGLGVTASILGLVVITLERYFKIVHAIAHRKYYRSWMTTAGVILPWFGGTCLILFPAMGTSRIVNGRCLKLAVWPNKSMGIVSIYVSFLRLTLIHLPTARVKQSIASVCLSVCRSVASCSQTFHSVCLSVCRSFHDLQPTTIDRSQPNLVGRSSDPCKPFWITYLPYFRCQRKKCAKFRLFPTRILATANVTHRAIWLVCPSVCPSVCFHCIFEPTGR